MKKLIFINIALIITALLTITFSLGETKSTNLVNSNFSQIRKNGNIIHLIDTEQQMLIFGTQEEIESNNYKKITTRKEKENGNFIPFKSLNNVVVLQDGTILLIEDIADGIFEYDNTGKFKTEHTRFENGVSLTNIIAIANNYNDTIYALQKDEGLCLLQKHLSDTYFEKKLYLNYSELSNFGINTIGETHLVCDFEKNLQYFTLQNKLFKIENFALTPIFTYEGQAKDIGIDYKGNPYVLLSDNRILKYENTVEYLQLPAKTMSFNFENGDITYIDNDNKIKTHSSNFVKNLSKFEHPVKVNDKKNLDTYASICTNTQNTDIYKYPLKVSYLNKLEANTKIIKLADSVEYPEYAYILTTINHTLTPCYVKKADIQPLAMTPINQKMRTFTLNTKLYKYPTADKLQNGESVFLTKIPECTEVLVKNSVADFEDSEKRTFYEIEYQDKVYYVMQAMLTTLSTEEGAVTLKPNNARNINNTPVYIYKDEKSFVIIGELPIEARFHVDEKNFDQHAKRTYIEYLNEENKLIKGYVTTDYVKIDNMNPFIIFGIFLVLIILILILTMILYFAKERKKIKNGISNQSKKSKKSKNKI